MKQYCITLLASCASVAPLWLHAFERDHQAHTHGEGTATIVIEQEIAHVHLALPAMDVVGFEHAPRTEAHRHTIHQAQALLSQPEHVIQWPERALCELASHQLMLRPNGMS